MLPCVHEQSTGIPARLLQLRESVSTSWSTRDSITITDIQQCIASTYPPHFFTATLFSDCMATLSDYSGSEKIASAGGVHALLDMLAHFPDERDVVKSACKALCNLSASKSATVQAALQSQQTLIPSLQASLKYRGAKQFAALALTRLGVAVPA
jgi:hypothetical protein